MVREIHRVFRATAICFGKPWLLADLPVNPFSSEGVRIRPKPESAGTLGLDFAVGARVLEEKFPEFFFGVFSTREFRKRRPERSSQSHVIPGVFAEGKFSVMARSLELLN